MDKYYHVAAHENMDTLMRYFDERGYMWGSGESPSSRYHYNYDIVCADDSDHTLTWMRHDNFVEYHQDETLIETCSYGDGIIFDGVYCAIGETHPSAIRPDYYQHEGRDLFDHFSEMFTTQGFRGFMVGNVIKYVIRYHSKNGVEDLRKARTYLDRLIQSEE